MNLPEDVIRKMVDAGAVRQGDLLLNPIPKPRLGGEVSRWDGTHILLKPHEDSNPHSIVGVGIEYSHPTIGSYIVTVGISLLQHAEHGEVRMAPGAWHVITQREWTPDGVIEAGD